MSRNKQLEAWATQAVGHPDSAVIQCVLDGGGEVRVAKRNGKPYILTRDYQPERVNLEVEHGIVTKVYFG